MSEQDTFSKEALHEPLKLYDIVAVHGFAADQHNEPYIIERSVSITRLSAGH